MEVHVVCFRINCFELASTNLIEICICVIGVVFVALKEEMIAFAKPDICSYSLVLVGAYFIENKIQSLLKQEKWVIH
jgi:hypothetical protein